MQIKHMMSADIVTIKMDDTVAQVIGLFEHHNFHHLLVVEELKLVGVLSDRDLLKAISPTVGTSAETAKDVACLHKRVHQVMTRNPVTLSAESGLLLAIKTFNQYAVSCLPIVDEDNRPVGILSWRDIFKFIEINQLNKHV